MTVLSILVVLAYVLAMILLWCKNYFQVQRVFEPPPFRWCQLNLPLYRAVSGISFVMTYGSVFGIWYFFGLWAGLSALGLRFVLGYISWTLHHKRKMKWLGDIFYYQIRMALSDDPKDQLFIAMMELNHGASPITEEMRAWTEAQLTCEARSRADNWIEERMRERQYL